MFFVFAAPSVLELTSLGAKLPAIKLKTERTWMSYFKFKRIFTLLGRVFTLSGIVVFTAISATTFSSLAGTPALVINSSDLRDGPSVAYAFSGSAVEGSAVSVERCMGHWCLIKADPATGWIDKSKLSFGQHARGPVSGPKFDRKSGGPGEVCFYEGENFSGRYVCGPSGFVIGDLAKTGFDNRIRSIGVSGNVSAMACRDFFLSSHCEHVTADTPALSRLLAGNVSSIRVY